MLARLISVVVMGRVRLAYLVTHPIQYQAPLLRRVAAEPDIDLTVFFCSDLSVRGFRDRDFGVSIKWDIPLLDGYRYEFLPAFGGRERISFWRPLNYGLARRLREGRFDVLWVHGYARWYHLLAAVAAKRRGLRVLIRDESTLTSRERGPTRRIAKRTFFSGLNAVADGFLAIGTLNAEYYRRLGVDARKIFFVPYAVDNAFFRAQAAAAAPRREELRAALGLELGRPVILYAAKMVPRKRPGDLLEAYARLSPDGRAEPSPYLLYVGDGCLRPDLEARAASLGWGSIKFLGFKNQSELPRYYDLCDVFVLPSVEEPWGLVVNEVMNAARPVVVTDKVGCARDLVKDGENGLVVEAGSIAGLAGALRTIVDDRAKCRAMGRRSLEIVGSYDFERDVVGLKGALAFLNGRRRSSQPCESFS